jgi:phage replication O-like protein O
MESTRTDPFVRTSTAFLEALFTFHLTGVQLRIVLWVLRNTDGWNRRLTPFRWYQIAKKLGGDRAVVWRAGQRLLKANVLLLQGGQVGIQKDYAQWQIRRLGLDGDGVRQLEIPGIYVAWQQRRPRPGNNATVACRQRERCLGTTLFRRAKERSKDKLKIYEKTREATDVSRQRFRNGAFNEHRHRAGAAKPIPGKYDGLSQN